MAQQPFYYDGSFYYGDTFQPLDSSFDNNFQPFAGHTWLNGNEEVANSFSPLCDVTPFPTEQIYLDSSQLNPASLHDSAYNSISPIYDFPIALEEPQSLPQRLSYPPEQLQPVEYKPESQTSVAILPSKIVDISVQPLQWTESETQIRVEDVPSSVKKRKARTIAPVPSEQDEGDTRAVKKSTELQVNANRSLEECMGLFDKTLTATKEKRRRKIFSAQEKKAVNSVRNVGACIQCKFRKKTCSAGRPCPYCARIAGSATLGAQLCHRESPFLDRTMAQYYPNTSRIRLIDFRISEERVKGRQNSLFIDGAGPVTLPLRIKIVECNMADLGAEDVASIHRTTKHADPDALPKDVQLLDPGVLTRDDLERWAVDYATHHTKRKIPHATGFLFGIEYAARNLPHSDLVKKITRLVSLNFVLRAGVTILPNSPAFRESPFRTIQAQIDTLLFQSFQATEKSLYRDLQRLTFRSAGSLARDAIIPVCFCIWQLARVQCVLASHLSNLATYNHKRSRRATPAPDACPKQPQAPPSAPAPPSHPTLTPSLMDFPDPNTEFRQRNSEAENLAHGLNLLLCTFEALFRTACPLLLNWSDTFSQDLLANDPHLVQMAARMGRTLRGYRDRGHKRKFKLGFGYKKEMADRIRGLLRER